jgi:hypothetical protein
LSRARLESHAIQRCSSLIGTADSCFPQKQEFSLEQFLELRPPR